MRFQEFAYRNWGTVESPDVVWPVKIRFDGVIADPSNVSLEVWSRYRPNTPDMGDIKTTIASTTYDPTTRTFTYHVQMPKGDFWAHGGFAYRVVYNGAEGNVVFPRPTASGQPSLMRPSINNRVFTCNWTTYAMNVASSSWHNYYASMVQALDGGVTFPRGVTVNFDAVFCDVVNPELVYDVYNRIEPIEYAGRADYINGMVAVLAGVDAAVASDMRLYLNCRDLELMDRLAGNTQIGGIVKENWTNDDWFENPYWTARFTHAPGRPNWRLILLEHEKPFHSALNDRVQAVVAFMVANNPDASSARQTLFGYGDWKDVTDSRITRDLWQGAKVLPEQMIPLGEPLSRPFDNVIWPTTAELMSWDKFVEIAEMRTNVSGVFLDPAQRFMGRRYRYLDGVNFNCAVWGMINTGSTGPSSAAMVDIVSPELIKAYYYELDLSSPDAIGNVLLTEGGGFRTIKRGSTEEWPTFPKDARIFFEQPVESPTIGSDFYYPHAALAEYDLQASDVSPVIAVRVSQWTTERMHEVRIAANRAKFGTEATTDFTDAGWPNDIILTDDGVNGDALADDGIYSARPGPIPAVGVGEYKFPIIVTGTDGLMRFGTVTAQVVAPRNVRFVNGSTETGDLRSLTGQPYSATYIRTNAVQTNEELMLVTKDGSDAASAPQMFKSGTTQSGSPVMENVTLGYFRFDSRPQSGGRGVSHADFDNDGDEDLFLCNVGQAKLYENQGGTFVDVTSAVFSAKELSFLDHVQVAAWGDYNRDGWIDLYVASFDYQGSIAEFMLDLEAKKTTTWSLGDALFRNHLGKMTRTTSVMSSSSGNPVWCASFNDVDADSLPDLVIGKLWGGAIVTHRNHGFFAVGGDYRLVIDWPSTSGLIGANSLSWIDYDHNQYPDLVVTDTALKQVCVLANSGSSFAIAETLDQGALWNGAAVADFDQDGQDDVLLLPVAGQPELHVRSGSAYSNLGPAVGFAAGSASGAVVTDFNNDGDVDVYLGRAGSGEFLYKNVRPEAGNPDNPVVAQQNFLQVSLKTMGSSNGSLIGAKVKVTKNSLQPGQPQDFYQTVDGGSGRGGQGDARLHFGLGSYAGTVSVTAYWPSGGSQTVPVVDPSANHLITITETGVPQIVSGPYFSTEPYPGRADWNFMWITDLKGDLRQDAVLFEDVNGYGVRNPCYAGPTQTLTWQSPNIRVRVDPHTLGWVHVLTWTDRPCLIGCGYRFTATSGVTGATVSSATTDCSGCVVTIPDVPMEQ
jgi:hypothetical protein